MFSFDLTQSSNVQEIALSSVSQLNTKRLAKFKSCLQLMILQQNKNSILKASIVFNRTGMPSCWKLTIRELAVGYQLWGQHLRTLKTARYLRVLKMTKRFVTRMPDFCLYVWPFYFPYTCRQPLLKSWVLGVELWLSAFVARSLQL